MPTTELVRRGFDPELAAAVGTLVSTDLTQVAESRAVNVARHAAYSRYPGRSALTVRDLEIPGADDLRPARLFLPSASSAAAPLGGALYLHGGAFALGDLDACDSICAQYSAEAEIAVLALDYRLAPEHPAPAALRDGSAALRWLADQAAGLGVDPGRIAVAGASAGGCLAAGTVLEARDHGGPTVAFQLLVQPVLDDRCETVSARAMTDTPVFDAGANRAMWDLYLAGRRADGYLAPARVDDLSGLPPTAVFAAQHDPLRDEALTYAARLLAAGTPTELHVHPGTFHGFDAVVPTAAVSRRATAEQAAALRRAIGPDAAPSTTDSTRRDG